MSDAENFGRGRAKATLTKTPITSNSKRLVSIFISYFVFTLATFE